MGSRLDSQNGKGGEEWCICQPGTTWGALPAKDGLALYINSQKVCRGRSLALTTRGKIPGTGKNMSLLICKRRSAPFFNLAFPCRYQICSIRTLALKIQAARLP